MDWPSRKHCVHVMNDPAIGVTCLGSTNVLTVLAGRLRVIPFPQVAALLLCPEQRVGRRTQRRNTNDLTHAHAPPALRPWRSLLASHKAQLSPRYKESTRHVWSSSDNEEYTDNLTLMWHAETFIINVLI